MVTVCLEKQNDFFFGKSFFFAYTNNSATSANGNLQHLSVSFVYTRSLSGADDKNRKMEHSGISRNISEQPEHRINMMIMTKICKSEFSKIK